MFAVPSRDADMGTAAEILIHPVGDSAGKEAASDSCPWTSLFKHGVDVFTVVREYADSCNRINGDMAGELRIGQHAATNAISALPQNKRGVIDKSSRLFVRVQE